MRIAYCLVGIVGSSNFGMGLGNPIDYRLAYYWNKKNIFDVNPNIDVFIHSWSKEFETGLVETYKPKKYIFEKQIDFQLPTIRDNSIVSRWYSTAMCNQLRQEYEIENNFKYDLVMFFRFDHVFLVPLNLKDMDNNKIWFRHRRPVGWTDGVRSQDNIENQIDTKKDVDLNTWESRRKFNLYPNDRVYDSFIISNRDNIDKYSDIYNEIDPENVITPHYHICLKLQKEGVWDKVDWKFFGEVDTEAIRALYKNPEYIETEFNINNFERFEEKFVRQNSEVISRFKSTSDNRAKNINLGNSGFKTELIQ